VQEGTGPCVDHAHWHLLPFAGELNKVLLSDNMGSHVIVPHWRDFLNPKYARQECLFYWDGEAARVVEHPNLPYKQYARSLVGRVIGTEPALWDWAVESNSVNFQATREFTNQLQCLFRSDGEYR
jgi:hypothetical protein